jgi:Uma2 family endonuclease
MTRAPPLRALNVMPAPRGRGAARFYFDCRDLHRARARVSCDAGYRRRTAVPPRFVILAAPEKLMSSAMQEWPRRHRISVEHYYRMAEAGLFQPDERVELIDGEIVDMPPMGTRHAGKLARLVEILTKAVGARAMVRTQLPLRLDDASEPQPDIALVLPRADYYEQRHPTPADTLLVVEIGDTTLRFDRDVKAPLYARRGVAETWVVDLRAERLLRFRAGGATELELAACEIDGLPGVTVDLTPLRSSGA